MDDLYRVLQVDPHADPEVIEVAWRRLARLYHPDGERPDPERMKAINIAHDVLKDPVRRAEYDRQRGVAGSSGDPRYGGRSGGSADRSTGTTSGHTGRGTAYSPLCWRHPVTAVARCRGCQAGLCSACATHWTGPYCDLCARREGVRLQLQILWPIVSLTSWLAVIGVAILVIFEIGGVWHAVYAPIFWGFYLGPGLVGVADLSWMLFRNGFSRPALRVLTAMSPIVLLIFCPFALFAGGIMCIVRAVLALIAFPRGRRIRQAADRFLSGSERAAR